MIVNSPLCTHSQGSELAIVIEPAPYSGHRASGQVNLPALVVWFVCGASVRLVVSNLRTFAVSFLPRLFPVTRAQSATDWFLGHLFSALSHLQASCPQITV